MDWVRNRSGCCNRRRALGFPMKLIDVYKTFATDEQCLAHLVASRWPSGVRCPICGAKEVSKITRKSKSKNVRAQLYQCLEKSCKTQFSATSGTIFHDSHLALSKWFTAIALIVDAKKGKSALELSRNLDVNYRTAWYLSHRIREAMNEPDGLKLNRTVEIDETYIGGRQKATSHETQQGRGTPASGNAVAL
jgi:transposase-like protein